MYINCLRTLFISAFIIGTLAPSSSHALQITMDPTGLSLFQLPPTPILTVQLVVVEIHDGVQHASEGPSMRWPLADVDPLSPALEIPSDVEAWVHRSLTPWLAGQERGRDCRLKVVIFGYGDALSGPPPTLRRRVRGEIVLPHDVDILSELRKAEVPVEVSEVQTPRPPRPSPPPPRPRHHPPAERGGAPA